MEVDVVSGFITWLIVSSGVAIFIWLWGWAMVRRARRIGRVLQAWSFVAPLGPPLATLVTWLLVGDAVPSGSDRHDPWSYTTSAAFLSLAFVLLVTPVLCVIVAIWALAGMQREEPPISSDGR